MILVYKAFYEMQTETFIYLNNLLKLLGVGAILILYLSFIVYKAFYLFLVQSFI